MPETVDFFVEKFDSAYFAFKQIIRKEMVTRRRCFSFYDNFDN